jgi:hypothetical protein
MEMVDGNRTSQIDLVLGQPVHKLFFCFTKDDFGFLS